MQASFVEVADTVEIVTFYTPMAFLWGPAHRKIVSPGELVVLPCLNDSTKFMVLPLQKDNGVKCRRISN